MRRLTTIAWLVAAALTPACSKDKEAPGQQIMTMRVSAEEPADLAKAAPAPPASKAAGRGALADSVDEKATPKRLRKKGKAGAATLHEDGEGEPTQTRSWFPETFLFKPLVVTDDDGAAEVVVRVPDQLTSWRVLALAHNRAGAQAGSETSFLGTLPVYVEPVVPPVLRSGDAVRLPINLVNTTSGQVTTELKLSAVGLQLRGDGGNVTIAASGSTVRYANLRADAPGKARLLARLGDTDAVVRTIDVVPLGRPVTQTRSGTLAAPRSLRIVRPAGADLRLGRVRLEVFPGALAILRSELSSSGGRDGELADDAYALLLAGRAPGLLRALGDKPSKEDRAGLRDLTILTTQRVMRRARVLDTSSAALLAEAALAHADNPVLRRLGERAKQQIVAKQSPDGSCGGETGWTLQRLLVATADCVRAVAGERRVAIRASGVFERNAARIRDPYTAAAVLASGAVRGVLAARLRKVVAGSIKATDDGAKAVVVPKGVVRADGVRPATVEATALAVLALKRSGEGQQQGQLADLGATIVGGYSPASGWGDGRANLVSMQAVLELFDKPIPAQIRITLGRDGVTVVQRELKRDRLREVLVLEAEAGAGSAVQQWSVTATPAVPGLGYSLTLTDRVPWQATPSSGGLELSVTPPKAPAVGRQATVAVRATAPGGKPLTIKLRLPAGVQVDRTQLDQLVEAATLSKYEVTDAELTLHAGALSPAKVFSADVRVIPTLAGSVHSGASSLLVAGSEINLPPQRWTIR